MPNKIPVYKAYECDADRRADRSFYCGKRWRTVREWVLSDNPLCNDCGNAANEAHHIIPRKHDPTLAYDMNNLISLCKSCRSIRTAKEQPQGGCKFGQDRV
jgi:5-methylcytosine-specific restriction protein A